MTADDSAAARPPIERVDSADDPRLGDYLDLVDPHAHQRHETDERLIVEGPVALAKLATSGLSIHSTLTTERQLERVVAMLAAAPVSPVYVVTPDVMRRTVGFNLHRGIVASARRPPRRGVASVLADASAAGSGLALVLEGLNDFENVGLITRTARAFGVGALVLDPTCLDPYHRRSVRVSTGEVLVAAIGRAGEWPGDLAAVRAAGFETWALTPDAAADSLWDLDPPARLALMVGAEGPGLGAATMAAADRRVRIPIDRAVDSLNVGHATAVALAAVRRRHH